MLFIVFFSWCFWLWTSAHDRNSATVIKTFWARLVVSLQMSMEDYSFFVMTSYRGFHWNMVRFMVSFFECLICYLLFLVVVSAWVIWSWTVANDWFSAAVIQAFQRISFFCKWFCETVHFLMTNFRGFQWNLVRCMISSLGCLLFFMLLIFFHDVFGYELRPMTGLALPSSKLFKRVLLFLCKWVWKTNIFLMSSSRGFQWNLVRFMISFFECLLCFLLFVVVLFSSFFGPELWQMTELALLLIQAFQRFSFLCKWVWKTSKFFVMTDYSVFQWGLLRFMILFLGCLIFYILFIVFVSWRFLLWFSAHDRVSATVIKSF